MICGQIHFSWHLTRTQNLPACRTISRHSPPTVFWAQFCLSCGLVFKICRVSLLTRDGRCTSRNLFFCRRSSQLLLPSVQSCFLVVVSFWSVLVDLARTIAPEGSTPKAIFACYGVGLVFSKRWWLESKRHHASVHLQFHSLASGSLSYCDHYVVLSYWNRFWLLSSLLVAPFHLVFLFLTPLLWQQFCLLHCVGVISMIYSDPYEKLFNYITSYMSSRSWFPS